MIDEYPETHQMGKIEITNPFLVSDIEKADGPQDFGVQIAGDGRVWVCVNGIAFLRFKPALDAP